MSFVFTVKGEIEQEKKVSSSVGGLGELMPVCGADLPEKGG